MNNSNRNPLFIILGVATSFFLIFLVVVVWAVMMVAPQQSQKKLFSKANRIGVVEVKGAIMDSKVLVDQLDSFLESENVKGVILRINSPGGAVGPSQEIYDAVKRLTAKKPTYASMGSVAASGGYYVALGTKKIYANAGTITGSIGVIMQFTDLSKLFEWAKVNPYAIKTGKFKDIGSPNREMGREEKELLQGMVDNVLSQFRTAVIKGRGLTAEKVVELSDGRIFSGEQAKQVHLVDELGGMHEAVEGLATELGIKDKYQLEYATKKRSTLERLMGADGEDAESAYEGNLFRSLLGRVLGVDLSEFSARALTSKHTGTGLMFLVPNLL